MVSLATALFVYDGCEVRASPCRASLRPDATPGRQDEADDSDDSACTKYTSIDWGSFAYFAVACVIFLACITGYIVLETLPLTKVNASVLAPAPASDPIPLTSHCLLCLEALRPAADVGGTGFRTNGESPPR